MLDELVRLLAPFENVAVKATCLPALVTESYPFPSWHPRLESVLEAFGPRRVFWGSDLTRLPCDYTECVGMFTRELDFLHEDDLAWVMGRGVEQWLGWQPSLTSG